MPWTSSTTDDTGFADLRGFAWLVSLQFLSYFIFLNAAVAPEAGAMCVVTNIGVVIPEIDVDSIMDPFRMCSFANLAARLPHRRHLPTSRYWDRRAIAFRPLSFCLFIIELAQLSLLISSDTQELLEVYLILLYLPFQSLIFLESTHRTWPCSFRRIHCLHFILSLPPSPNLIVILRAELKMGIAIL